jgi:hypothetical protein
MAPQPALESAVPDTPAPDTPAPDPPAGSDLVSPAKIPFKLRFKAWWDGVDPAETSAGASK